MLAKRSCPMAASASRASLSQIWTVSTAEVSVKHEPGRGVVPSSATLITNTSAALGSTVGDPSALAIDGPDKVAASTTSEAIRRVRIGHPPQLRLTIRGAYG